MPDERPQVAILGLGTMGSGMAQSLLRSEFEPDLWDRNPQRLGPFERTAGRIHESVADAVRDARVVITMVSDAAAVMELADDKGMVDALAPGAVWAQMGTIGVRGTELAAAFTRARRPDVAFVDAPVTGSREGAANGTLTIFASGPDAAREVTLPVFDALGSRTIWLGPAGLGSRLKLVNNTMIAFIAHGLGEAVALARHFNLTGEAVAEAFSSGMFASAYISGKLERMARHAYDPQFSLSLALKDVKLALETVDRERHPVFDSLARQWQQAVDDGLGGEDLTVITRILTEPA